MQVTFIHVWLIFLP